MARKHAEGKGDELGCSSRNSGDYELYDEVPRLRSGRPEATRELSHRASPLYESMGRGELEAQSARLISQLRRSMRERAGMLPPLPNELVIRRDSARPSDAGRREQSRREPSASNLLGQVPVKPGRGLFSDTCMVWLTLWTAPNNTFQIMSIKFVHSVVRTELSCL